MIGLVVFVGVILLIIGGIHVYLWKRLVRDTTRPGWPRRLGTGAAILLFVLVPVTLIGTRTLSLGPSRILAWPGYLWIAAMFYLLLTLLVLELPRAAVWLNRRRRDRETGPDATATEPAVPTEPAAEPAEPSAQAEPTEPVEQSQAPEPSRRLFLARSIALVAGATTVGTVGYGTVVAMGRPRVHRVAVPLRRLDPKLDGFRIALVSDLHLGPILRRGFTERVVETVNAQRPDLIAVVGDLVDGSVVELGREAEPLRRLQAPHGSYFVTGNHEYYVGVEAWVDEVRSYGLTVLRNQRVEVEGAGAFDLAGVNDPTGRSYDGGPNLDMALAGRDPDRAVVLLAHQPVQVGDAAKRGVDLQLSGHTHGGQLWPFDYAVRLEQPVVSGLAKVDGTWLYVTNGVGSWGPPVRVGAPPEVTIVELHAAR